MRRNLSRREFNKQGVIWRALVETGDLNIQSLAPEARGLPLPSVSTCPFAASHNSPLLRSRALLAVTPRGSRLGRR